MNEPVTIEREMGLTHREFFRSLPHAVRDLNWRQEGAGAVVEEGDGRRLEIRLGPEGERRIALLAIPCTRVTLSFHGYGEDQRRDFMIRFERAFQRGGG